jgi:hypothetical protein
MRVGIELSSNNGGKAFTRLLSGACNRAEVCSPPPYFVDPKYVYIRESAFST